MNQSLAFQKFVAAIALDQDEKTEALVTELTASDEPALLTLLKGTHADQRWWAARALAFCGTQAAVPSLVTALADKDATLRATAALALGHLYTREPDAVIPVFEQLAAKLADEEGVVRQTIADALIMCGDSAVPALARELDGDHAGARTRAAYALRKIATMKAAGVLYHHLNDTNYLVRMYAYEGLEEMGLLENILVTL